MTTDSHNPKELSEFEKIVEEQLPLLKTIESSWQPTDVLPNLTDTDWRDQVQELRDYASRLPKEVLVALVGNTVTEEALPTYQTWLNRYPEMRDSSGIDASPWAVWTRAWTAEENRHGDVLNRYLYLTGRINMRSVEITTQNLLSNGFDPKAGEDPYMALVYVSFQERATRISHGNVARLARQYEDPILSKICQLVAGDETRHEEAYKRIYGKLFEIYPKRCILSFYKMMKQRVGMPASRMSDGTGRNLYEQFSNIAQRIGVYSIQDYADIIDHLVNLWKVPSLTNLSGDEAKAQDYLCRLADRYAKKSEIVTAILQENPPTDFQWLFEGAEHQVSL
jgi:acyl-[acyl-carrier-protein] desaturase